MKPAGEAEIDLKEIYEAHHARLFRQAFRLTGDGDRAADLVQRTFLKASEALESFRGESDIGTWLHQILYRFFLQEERKRGRFLPFSTAVRSRGRRDPEQEAITRETGDLIQKALGGLPPEQRALLIFRELEGHSYREIARTLGVSEGTVASRLSRAREALRGVLEDLGYEPPGRS